MRLLPRVLEDEPEADEAAEASEEAEPSPPERPLHWAWTLGIATAAAVPRLLYLFVFSDPENPGPYGDVWHHWQIAYLTKEIGLAAPGGPRLWDLKGLDYVWGILHPLLMVAVFDLTGSVDIVLDRLVSLASGVVSVVLLFHLSRRFWGTHAAVAVALFGIFLPTNVMNDASGMVEPLGVMLCLLGVWAWTNRADGRAGLIWGVATMARAEAWLFGLGMVVAALVRRRSLPVVAGFVAVMAVYMKILLDQTGNPIYPLWWNFFATALGQWQPAAIAPDQAAARLELVPLSAVSAAGLAWSLWRRPAGYMLLVFGFGYSLFATGMFGLTAYLSTWVWWLPVSRRFEFPVFFVTLLVAVALLAWMPSRWRGWSVWTGWAGVGAALVASQLLWAPIYQVFGNTEAAWRTTIAESEQLGAWYNAAPYTGHALAVPADRPDITYGLAVYGHVEGKHLVSEMYDPFAYLPAGYQYAEHRATVDTLVRCWIGDSDIALIAVNETNLAAVRDANPPWFTRLGTLPAAGWDVEAVSVPRPSPSECAAAKAQVH